MAHFANKGWNLTFRRWLDEAHQEKLRKMIDMLVPCALSNNRDQPKWPCEKNGKFSVNSQYKALCEGESEDRNKRLRKAKIPLKIKIFMWLIKMNAILTRDNFARKRWKGDKSCSFCANPESIEHLFFGCVMSKYCWSLVSIVIGADFRPASFD